MPQKAPEAHFRLYGGFFKINEYVRNRYTRNAQILRQLKGKLFHEGSKDVFSY